MQIKKGDNVIILTGKDRGKSGKVLRAFPSTDRVIIESANLRRRRVRPRRSNEKGQVIEKAEPMHVSNVAIFCASCKKGVRSRVKVDSKGNKSRVCVKCDKAL